MFSRQHLDSPPPQSQFRRPWSPDPNDPYPSVNRSRNLQQDPYFSEENTYESQPELSRYHLPPTQLRQQYREASDGSVEALDLADYARTLRPHGHWQPELELDHPPSLISRGGTLSSSSHSSVPSPGRRPFSLPPPSSRHSPYRSRNTPPTSYRSNPYGEPDIVSSPAQSEADISQYPSWSRNWYNPYDHAKGPISPPDIYSPLPTSIFEPKHRSSGLFDPNHTLKRGSYSQVHDTAPMYTSSYGHESTRDLLPWSSDPPEYGPSIDDNLKAERIRMLEREFGSNARSNKNSAQDNDFLDENGKPLLGTVDSKGNLVTQGPRKRVLTRVMQILLAMLAAIPSIYAAILIKPSPAAPPAGTLAAYVLYAFSVITLFALLFVFMIYPCCIRRNKGSGATGKGANPLANGMMVLPVQGLPGGKQNKKAKGGKGKKGKGTNMGGGDVQVNLIVDPNIFGGNRDEEDEDDDDEEEEEAMWDWERSSVPGGWNSSNSNAAHKKKKRKRAKRRSVFVGLAMEEEWKKARSFRKKIMAFDIFGVIIWGAVFVIILLGKRCGIGEYDGWCNAYNVSSAAACLLCFVFGLSTFFDIKDLGTSKVSPRTRT